MSQIASTHTRIPHFTTRCGPGSSARAPDAEPPIDLDTMLDLTAAAEVDGVKFDGVDLFLFDPHVSIDSTDDDLKRLADKIARAESRRRLARRAGLAADRRRLGDGQRRGPQALPRRRSARPAASAQKLRELGIRHVRRRPDRLGLRARRTGRRTRPATRRRIAETFREACDDRRRATASGSPPKARSAGAACTAGSAMLELLEMVDRPQTLGFQADMAHTLLFTLGYNAPEDRILPEDFDWTDRRDARRRAARR